MPDDLPLLDASERARYARHLSLPEFGESAQRKLKASAVLCLGAGGLGSPAAMYLAAAGVGRLGIVDPDRVDASNIQRQLLHGSSDVGLPKVESAAARLTDLNPNVELDLHRISFNEDNALDLARGYDLILDGTDNFPSRYLSNDVASLLGIPLVYGSIFRFEGQVSVFAPHLGAPCYRCLFPDPPEPGAVPDRVDGGVLGVLPGVIGTLQATEAIKLIANIGNPLLGKLLHYDALAAQTKTFTLRPDPKCALCGDAPSITEPKSISGYACSAPRTTVHELRADLANDGVTLLDVREPSERSACKIEPSLAIPLGELPTRLEELPRSGKLYVHCKAGGRSARAVSLLIEAGFDNAIDVLGGIDAWRTEIDPAMPDA